MSIFVLSQAKLSRRQQEEKAKHHQHRHSNANAADDRRRHRPKRHSVAIGGNYDNNHNYIRNILLESRSRLLLLPDELDSPGGPRDQITPMQRQPSSSGTSGRRKSSITIPLVGEIEFRPLPPERVGSGRGVPSARKGMSWIGRILETTPLLP